MPHIFFLDVTNRDGAQTSRLTLSKLQKTLINWYLGRLGVHQSEFGFPFTPHERRYVEANLALQSQGVFGGLVLGGWCRALAADVEKALASGVRDFNLSMSTSDQMIASKFRGRLDRAAIIREAEEAVRTAVAGGARTVGINAEDGSRTDPAFLVEFAAAGRAAGAQRLRYCDTIGRESPLAIAERAQQLAEDTGLAIEMHCHNDLGMAVANSLAGAQGALAGSADVHINTCVNGIGERAGNADLLSCILGLRHGNGLPGDAVADRIDLTVAWKLGTYVARALGQPVPLNQVGVGGNAFAHESGIHADGALKDHRNYELYDYPALGRPEQESLPTGRLITVGDHSGLAALRYVYEGLGLGFDSNGHAQEILELVQYANLHNHLPLTEDELRFVHAHPAEVAHLLTVTPETPRQAAAAPPLHAHA
jgi:homocitrate synthase NifV